MKMFLMVKESEVGTKKRKKLEGPVIENENKKTEIEANKSLAMSIYQKTSSYEENEALSRDTNSDLKLFGATCSKFSNCINEIADLKFNKPEGWKEKVLDKKVDGALLTIIMKKLNRIEKIRNKTSREEVTKVRQQVDVLQLQLQNLLCEIQRLQQEVDKCNFFKSKPLGIDLVPVDEFYKNAPPQISRPDTTKNDEHLLQLARLEWELKQRKELALLSKQLEDKQNQLLRLIEKRVIDLSSLSPLIKDVLNVTKPMQEKLGLPSTRFLTKDYSSLLPDALYFLYIQSCAYSETCGKRITVDILGDKDKAKLMKRVSSPDDSTDESEEEIYLKKETKEKQDLKRKKLVLKHPLSVILKMTLKDRTSISLEFFYLINMKIMTVQPNIIFSESLTSPAANLLISNDNIMRNLFPEDDGIISPNVANHYQLLNVGLDNFDSKITGMPYLWVQRIGGLNFQSGSTTPQSGVSKINVPLVLKEISKRIKSRSALVKQILDLERGNVIHPRWQKSLKLSCRIKNWQVYSWDEYKKHPSAQYLIENDNVTENDIFFKCVIVRDQAILHVFVSINCNYPSTPPLCVLQLELNHKIFDSRNSSDIINIEREINVFWKESMQELDFQSLLTSQIYRIMICFDIMLECIKPESFNTEKKTFFYPSRGRNRSRPYKYEDIGEGVFLQR